MAAFRVVADLVVRLVTEPLWDLPVLLRLSCELLLNEESLVGRLYTGSKITGTNPIEEEQKKRLIRGAGAGRKSEHDRTNIHTTTRTNKWKSADTGQFQNVERPPMGIRALHQKSARRPNRPTYHFGAARGRCDDGKQLQDSRRPR